MQTTARAIWDRDTQRSFFRRLVMQCEAIGLSGDPKAAYLSSAKWLDRMYSAIAIPPRVFAQADNRLLLALMRAEQKQAA